MPFDPILTTLRDEHTQQLVWIGVAGASLVLLQSILSGTRRSWFKLLASCIIGGSAAALTGHVFSDSPYVYLYCGIAAVMAENIIFGLFNASEQFKENPINTFAQLWRIMMPAWGRGIDKPGLDLPEDGPHENEQGGGYGSPPRRRRRRRDHYDDGPPVG
ncbi:hypothetical protein [Erythrobacter phage vB_EliS-L02]|nr:hypothetical protein [Erythrobacter phage vB_EliS-L02]